jgi:hypothetical protein
MWRGLQSAGSRLRTPEVAPLFGTRGENGVSYAQDKLNHVPQCAARKLSAVSSQLSAFDFRGLLGQIVATCKEYGGIVIQKTPSAVRCGACFSLPWRVKLACRLEDWFIPNSATSGVLGAAGKSAGKSACAWDSLQLVRGGEARHWSLAIRGDFDGLRWVSALPAECLLFCAPKAHAGEAETCSAAAKLAKGELSSPDKLKHVPRRRAKLAVYRPPGAPTPHD